MNKADVIDFIARRGHVKRPDFPGAGGRLGIALEQLSLVIDELDIKGKMLRVGKTYHNKTCVRRITVTAIPQESEKKRWKVALNLPLSRHEQNNKQLSNGLKA
jgi:hypothetical protein